MIPLNEMMDMMQCNKFFTKGANKRRIRNWKAAAKSFFSQLDCDRRVTVRFNKRDSIHEVPKMTASDMDEPSIWYNKKELNEQFLKDLDAHLRVRKAQADDNSNSFKATNSSRGLEFVENERRREKAEAYVKHIVQKSFELRQKEKPCEVRKAGLLQHGRKKKRDGSKHPAALQHYAQEIGEYAQQYTWMTTEMAIGVAAMDEAEARAIYQEGETKKSDSVEFQPVSAPIPTPKRLSYMAQSA
jgi:hypothetical protein